jgi:Ca2+-transporting ATPase
VPTESVVPGDVVLLSSGSLIPADGQIISGASLEVDESMLTGESLPVAKEAVEGDASSLFAGSLVTRGSAKMSTITTGRNTRLGSIAEKLDRPPTTTPLQEQLATLSGRLGIVAIGIAAVVLVIIGVRQGGATGWEQAFLTAVALAVAAVPEGLPTAVTLALALGVRRMASRGAIIRRLPAVETLGSATVILSDKTGTLTENRISAVGTVDGEGVEYGAESSSPNYRAMAEVAVVCNDAELDPTVGDPIDIALLEPFAETVGFLRTSWERVAEEPFDSATKRQVVVAAQGKELRVFVKGAPETILSDCSLVLTPDGPVPLDEARRARLAEKVARDASSGYRMIALARKHVRGGWTEAMDWTGLTLVGLVQLRDPVRSTALDTVAAAHKAGIEVVMVTGDHPGTAASVAAEVGIESGSVTSGHEFGDDPDPLHTRIYARVQPEQKLALAEALKQRGHVVAVTGDGVNDAPALRAAHIGVAMGASGSEVARQAADMVVTDDDLGTVIKAVGEGRAIYDDIRKVVEYLIGGNLSELAVVIGALFLLPSIGIPLLPLQLLWINLLTDALPALALGIDPGAPDLMRRPPRPSGAALLDGARLRLLTIRALIMSTAALGAGLWEHASGQDGVTVRTSIFTALVLVQVGYAYVVRYPTTGLSSNPMLAVAVLGALGLQVVALTWRPVSDLLGVVALDTAALVATAIAAAGPLVVLGSWERARHRRVSRTLD